MNKKIKHILSIFLTIIGFAIAAILNILIPQKAEGVTFETHQFFGTEINSNQVYRLVLVGIIILYIVIGIVAARSKERRKKYQKAAKFRFVMGLLLLLWDVLGTKYQILTQPFFPGPAGIMEAFVAEGDFVLQNTLYSLRLYLVGFLSGTFAGIITGVLVTLLPTPFSAAVFLIAVAVWILVATLTAAGVESTPKTQFEAGRTLGGNEWYLVFHVALPHALPQIFTGITTANGYAFTTLVMAEMMGQPGGLGYYINASKVWSAYYKVFAAIIVMAILFSIITNLIELLQKHMLRWKKGVVR